MGDGEILVQDVVLRDVGDLRAECGSGAVDVLAVVQNLALPRRRDASKAVQQGRLAGAAAADQCDELAGIDGERDAVEQSFALAADPDGEIACVEPYCALVGARRDRCALVAECSRAIWMVSPMLSSCKPRTR